MIPQKQVNRLSNWNDKSMLSKKQLMVSILSFCLFIASTDRSLLSSSHSCVTIRTKAELEEVRKENAKLKFRRDILLRSIQEIGGTNGPLTPVATTSVFHSNMGSNVDGVMTNINLYLKELFGHAIEQAFPGVSKECPPAIMPSKKELGYQMNSAMKIANVLKGKGTNIKPQEAAQKVVDAVPANDLIAVSKVAGPGFVDVRLDSGFLSKEIRNLLINGIKVREPFKQKVVIDYSSPNIAKEMHVGHLRSTIIGDCLANVLEFLGHEVVRVNHIGDWGTQFGMLLAHLLEKYPDCLTNPPPISDLQSFYKQAKKRFDDEEEFKKRAYAAVVSLQSKEPTFISAWKLICEISRKEFKGIYDMLGVKNLIEMGESFYHDKMGDVVKDLESRGFLVEEEGRKLFFPKNLTAQTNIPLTVVKSDGGYTYDTSDMACIRHRVQSMKADRVIYVVDGGQGLHFQTLYACAAECGYYDPEKVRVEHVAFGVVLGEDKKKFKTRSGDTVRLRDLLNEGVERARMKLKDRGRTEVMTEEELKDAEVALAIGCIKYADLKQDRNHEYEFSFDRMLEDRGNTAVYLLYTLTRIRSIKRNANIDKETSELAREIQVIDLTHEKEFKLANFLVRFPEVICQVAADLFPHTLCSYIFDLCSVFSEFYEKCYCIEKIKGEDGNIVQKVNLHRILLCEATAAIMEQSLTLLGIRTVSKM